VLVALTSFETVFAAKAATKTIPIVFAVSDDPVKLGLVASLARPGGNATGVNFYNAELTAKRLELLREMVPGGKRIALLVNPSVASVAEPTIRDVETAAPTMGVKISVINATTSGEIDAAFPKHGARAGRRAVCRRRLVV
jgi:putative ABC transport system substrate-binding protein